MHIFIKLCDIVIYAWWVYINTVFEYRDATGTHRLIVNVSNMITIVLWLWLVRSTYLIVAYWPTVGNEHSATLVSSQELCCVVSVESRMMGRDPD